VPDIAYVIDFCLTKEITYNAKSNLDKLELTWASHASLKQRAGRTGRICDGYSFKLIPKQFYEQ